MNPSKLAILVNMLDGYDEAESATGVPAELIQKAIEGEQLTGYENALLETGFNKLYLEDDRGLDLDDLFGMRQTKFGEPTAEGTTTGLLDKTLDFLDRTDLQNEFRALVADGSVDLGDLETGFGLFANLTSHQAEMVLDGLRSGDADAGEMFAAYLADGMDFWNIEDSDFWEWFRDTFYDDQ